MKLVADSGSTSTRWCLTGREAGNLEFSTEGYNPYYVDRDYIVHSLSRSLPGTLEPGKVSAVYFYGAGCMLDRTPVIERALQSVFPMARVQAEIDLLAAARSLLGREPGFAAILGTGTNTCVYDGDKITRNIDSLGFMLGDEGSGTDIGKRLLQAYLRGYMPEEVRRKFSDWVKLDSDEIMDRVYNQSLANRFCAGFAEFAGANIEMPYVRELVRDAFTDFFLKLVSRYPNYREYAFNCLGSVGFHFKNILEEVAGEFNMPTGKIVLSPMEGLLLYHAGS